MFPPAVQSWEAARLCAKRFLESPSMASGPDGTLSPSNVLCISMSTYTIHWTNSGFEETSLWGWAKNPELGQYPLQVNSLGLCAIVALHLKPSADPVPTMLLGDSWKYKYPVSWGYWQQSWKGWRLASAPKRETPHGQSRVSTDRHMRDLALQMSKIGRGR